MLGPLFLITLSAVGLFVLLVPAILISFAGDERTLALEMSLLASLGAFVGIMILTALAGRIRGLERELNFVSLVLIWALLPLVAALCLMVLTGVSFMPAWFEAVSALTTTGASVLQRDTLTTGILFWRAALEWYGGLLTLISIIHVMAPAGFGGLRPSGRRRATVGHRHGRWDALNVYSSIFWQYGALTAFITLGLLTVGVLPGNAIMLAMISIATGGFLPFTEPLEEHIGPAATFIMAIGFCFGTLSVFWRSNILRHPHRLLEGNYEARIALGVIVVLSLVYAARIADVSGTPTLSTIPPMLLEGFFTASSLVATSGIETRPGVIALLPEIIVLMIVFVGASVYSTTGGVKIYRIVSMSVFARAELNRLIYPRGVSPLKFSDQPIPEDSIRAVWAYFVLALLCVAAGMVAITFSAADFEGGLALTVALFSSAGPAYDALRPAADEVAGAAAAGWPRFQDLPPGAIVPAIVLMTIGRLEVLIVFAVINVRYWLKR